MCVSRWKVFFIFPLALFWVAGCGSNSSSLPVVIPSEQNQDQLLYTPEKTSAAGGFNATAMPCPTPENWSITFTKNGGLAGIAKELFINSKGKVLVHNNNNGSSLETMVDSTQIQEIRSLLEQACPFEAAKATRSCADCFVYYLSIQVEGQNYKTKLVDGSIPVNMEPLIQYLSNLFLLTNAP
jgi:hypothetical protein